MRTVIGPSTASAARASVAARAAAAAERWEGDEEHVAFAVDLVAAVASRRGRAEQLTVALERLSVGFAAELVQQPLSILFDVGEEQRDRARGKLTHGGQP